MKKILLLTTCLLGTLVAAGFSILPTDPDPKYQAGAIPVGFIPMKIDEPPLKRRRGEEGAETVSVSSEEQINRTVLEEIEATIEGVIRFNRSVLSMLKDNETSIGERLSEFSEVLGFSRNTTKTSIDIITKNPAKANEILGHAIERINQSYSELIMTKTVCNLFIQKKDYGLESQIFIAFNILFRIAALESKKKKILAQTKDQSYKSIELTFYKRMQRYLRRGSMPHHLFDTIERMFVLVQGELDFFYNPYDSLQKSRSKIEKLRKYLTDMESDKVKKSRIHSNDGTYEDLSKLVGDINSHQVSFGKIQEEFDLAIKKFPLQKQWGQFSFLKKFFENCLLPCMQCEITLKDLENQIDVTAQKAISLQAIIKKSRPTNNLVMTKAQVLINLFGQEAFDAFFRPKEDGKSSDLNRDLAAALSLNATGAADSLMKSSALVEPATTTKPPQSSSTTTRPTESNSSCFMESSALVKPATTTKPPQSSSSCFMESSALDLRVSPTSFRAKENKSKAVSLVGERQGWMKTLKTDKKLNFGNTLKEFTKFVGATIEVSKLTEITFRGPYQKLTKIFCHTPHGAQLEKLWPAWRHNMISGLREAGFKF